jgi:tetratricopeptide (TPR) repeat protein
MKDEKSKVIETLRKRYLEEYKHSYRAADRIAFFEEMRNIAAAAEAPVWERFSEGMLAGLKKDYETALALLDAVIELDSEFAFAWNSKGNFLQILNRNDEALAMYDNAIKLDPKFAYPWNGKGHLFADLNRNDEALEMYQKVIELDAEAAYAWNGKGIAFRALRRDEEGLAAYEKAIELDPEFALGHYNCGVLHWRQGRTREAAESFQRAIDLGLDPSLKENAVSWVKRASRIIDLQEAGNTPEESKQTERSSNEALVTTLFEALQDDLPGIQAKKKEFEERIGESVGKLRIVGTSSADNMLIVLRDWNSFSPILKREFRDKDIPGPRERRGGGYLLVWKGHGVVIDPGVDFVTQLYRKGLSIADVDTVIVTHCHLDHTRDVESLVCRVSR